MLDAVALEQRGVPTVTLATTWFREAARAQATMAGLPDLPIVTLAYVSKGQGHWLTRAERTALIEHHWEEIVAGLTDASPGEPVPTPSPA